MRIKNLSCRQLIPCSNTPPTQGLYAEFQEKRLSHSSNRTPLSVSPPFFFFFIAHCRGGGGGVVEGRAHNLVLLPLSSPSCPADFTEENVVVFLAPPSGYGVL